MIVKIKKNFNGLFLLILILQLFIFFNYVSWFLNEYVELKFFRVFLIFSVLSIIFLILFKVYKENKLLAVIFIFLLIACLGSPSFHWDARSIWLFYSKQIFFDRTFQYIFDNYSPLHTISYPVLGPTLASSLADTLGFWNEIFPKFFSFILSIPILVYLYFFLENKTAKFLYGFIIFFIFDKSLIIGEMDGLVALYFTASTLISIQLFKTNDPINLELKSKNKFLNINFFYVFAFLNFTFLSILKKEAFVYLTIIFFSLIVSNFYFQKYRFVNKKILIIFLISLINFVFWEYYTSRYNVDLTNYPGVLILFEENFSKIFFTNVLNMKNFFLISKEMFLNKPFLISIILSSFLIVFAYKKNKNSNKKELVDFLSIFVIVILYLLFVYFVYYITSYDLLWHLKTSATRVMLPLSFFISYITLIFVQKKLNFIN